MLWCLKECIVDLAFKSIETSQLIFEEIIYSTDILHYSINTYVCIGMYWYVLVCITLMPEPVKQLESKLRL